MVVSPEVYLALKQLHRVCAVLSIAGFAARWAASLAMQAWVRGRLARTLPHVVDTALLLSALAMAFGAAIVPTDAPWLATKIVLLLVYIGLGMVALSVRRSRGTRLLAGVAALLVFGHIVAVAWVKHPAGLLQRLA